MTAHEIYKLWEASAKMNSREARDFSELSHSEREVWASFALLLRDAFRPLVVLPADVPPVN